MARLLRSSGKTVFVAANKVDAAKLEAHAAEFHRFGFEDVLPVSAEIGDGVAELLDALVEHLPPQEAGVEDEETYKFLFQEGCDIVQGYYLSKPLPSNEFISWLNHTIPTHHAQLLHP